MRAWHCSSFIVLFAVACGGSEATLDGGDDSGSGNDGTVVDTGGGNDGGVSDSTIDDAPFFDGSDGAPIEAGPFDPSQLGTNLVLWLDGAKGITKDTNNAANVQTWADQTSYHNDATGGSGQFAHEPTINATAINNLPAVQFSGGFNPPQYLTITDSASLELGTGDFAIFMVAAYTNTTQGNGAGQGAFFDKVAGNTTPTGPQLYGNAFVNNAFVASVRARINQTDNVNSVGQAYNDGKYHRIGIRRNGTALEVWTDATVASFTPDAGGGIDVSATGSDVYIGAAQGGQGTQLRLVGGIAEVIGVKGTLSSSDVTNLDGYFKSKYAL